MGKSHFSKCKDTDKEKVEGECVQYRKIKIYMSIYTHVFIAQNHIGLGEKMVVNSTGKMLVMKLRNYSAKNRMR